ncbi:unnamed protein product [Adineta ricciae]|uniref:Uncharacterized protein n=1 Tax=Adineta ricciae TaxID=249248 RepID=A0A815TS94_ADIRI|nr:unnamed protein product [Adineta ricciae]
MEVENTQMITIISSNTIERKKSLWIIFLASLSILTLIIPIIIIIPENANVEEIRTIQSIGRTLATTLQKQMKWKKKGITIAGGLKFGKQLYSAKGISLDDDNNIYITDNIQNCIVKWKIGSNSGEIIVNGGFDGDLGDGFNHLEDVIIDKYYNNSLILCELSNNRVIRWFLEKKTDPQIIVTDVECSSLALDKDGSLYVVDQKDNSVKRWKQGEKNGTTVAGGNGQGSRLDQLWNPGFILIDDNYTIYISDTWNNRIMKWVKNATEGIMFNGIINPNFLEKPQGLAMDRLGQLYIADSENHRILRWREGEKQGEIIINEYGKGRWSVYLNEPNDILFDSQGNLIVSDNGNSRVQKFVLDFD